MPETQVLSLGLEGLENHPEEGMATHSSILAWEIPVDRGAWWATVHRTEQLNSSKHMQLCNQSTKRNKSNPEKRKKKKKNTSMSIRALQLSPTTGANTYFLQDVAS